MCDRMALDAYFVVIIDKYNGNLSFGREFGANLLKRPEKSFDLARFAECYDFDIVGTAAQQLQVFGVDFAFEVPDPFYEFPVPLFGAAFGHVGAGATELSV